MTELVKAARLQEALRRVQYEAVSLADAQVIALEALTQALATTEHECSRSHPHENMSPMCELRTEIARLRNENTRLKHSTTERKGEPVAKFDEIKGRPVLLPDSPMLKHGDLLYTSPQETERKGEPVAWMLWTHGPVLVFLNKDEAKLEFDRLNHTYPEPARKLIPLYTSPQVPEDTARLDWIERQSLDDFAIGFVGEVEEYWCSPESGGMYYGKTLREAIDAARKGE